MADALQEALGDATVPLETTDPTAPLADGSPIPEVLGDATVIGLGEATHGTREFFRAKHRILRYLVEEAGLRLFAVEANFSAGLDLTEYVLDGEGDPEVILDREPFHQVWNTREMVDLVEWLREFNEGRPREDRVRVFGYDAQYAQAAARRLESSLKTLDPAALVGVESGLTALQQQLQFPEGEDDEDRREAVRSRIEAAERVVADLRDRFESEHETPVGTTSRREWQLARRHVAVLDAAREGWELRLEGDHRGVNDLREETMADTVEWLLDSNDSDTIAVWAHNAHVRTGTLPFEFDDPVETLGARLRDRFGDEYYSLGFEFGTGGYQAFHDAEDEDRSGFAEFVLDDVPADALAAPLTDLDAPVLFLDVERGREDPAVREWLDGERRMHLLPGVFRGSEAEAFVDTEFSAEYDGLLYVDETTRARPVDDGDRFARGSSPD